MPRYVTLTPAYGRDYTNKADAVKDFNDNKDFVLNAFGDRYDGKPCNKEDLARDGVGTVSIRYKKLTKIVTGVKVG